MLAAVAAHNLTIPPLAPSPTKLRRRGDSPPDRRGEAFTWYRAKPCLADRQTLKLTRSPAPSPPLTTTNLHNNIFKETRQLHHHQNPNNAIPQTKTAMSSTAPTFTFYIDSLSPWSYLAISALQASPSLASLHPTFIPVFLPGIMSLTANTPPIACPQKAAYSMFDLRRQARKHNIPLLTATGGKLQHKFPTNTLFALRCCVVLQGLDEPKMVAVATALSTAYWNDARDLGDAEVVRAVLQAVLGAEQAAEVEAAANEPAAKEKLDANTKAAVEGGCFGLPWFVVEKEGKKESFWGFEKFAEAVRGCGIVWKEGEERMFAPLEAEARL